MKHAALLESIISRAFVARGQSGLRGLAIALVLASGGAWVGACARPWAPAAQGSPPIASASAVASALASASAAAPDGPPSPFSVVVQDQSVTMLPVSGATLFTSDDWVGTYETDGALHVDPKLMEGLEFSNALAFLAMGGRWPSQLYSAVGFAFGRTGFSVLRHWTGQTWEKFGTTDGGQGVFGVIPYEKESVLIAEEWYEVPGYDLYSVSTDGKKHPIRTALAPHPTRMKLSRVQPFAIDALETGEIFVAGMDTTIPGALDPDMKTNAMVVERLSSAGSVAIERLPVSNDGQILLGKGATLASVSATDVWLSTSRGAMNATSGWDISGPYLAHFDGKSWKEQPSPSKLYSFSVRGRDRAGVVWAVAGENEIWKRPRAGQWTPLALPSTMAGAPEMKNIHIDSLRITHDGVAFVSVIYSNDNSSVTALLSTRAPAKISTLPRREGDPPATMYGRSPEPDSLPRPPSPGCTRQFVLLYTLSKSAPADFDYPATRKALKGHTEFSSVTFVELTRDRQRFMGAMFEKGPGSWALPKKMAEIVKKAVPGSAPQVVCYEPEVSRIIPINLKTGAIDANEP